MSAAKPFCRRCLLEDMPSEAELAQSIRELIDLLPEHMRTPAQITAARLAACRACDRLHSGMCTLCGCYVELRAAKAPMHCPDIPARW